jgi:hypothetical protein
MPSQGQHAPQLNTSISKSVTFMEVTLSHIFCNLGALKALNTEVPLHGLLLIQSALQHSNTTTWRKEESRTSFQTPLTLNVFTAFLIGRCQAPELMVSISDSK